MKLKEEHTLTTDGDRSVSSVSAERSVSVRSPTAKSQSRSVPGAVGPEPDGVP